MLLLAACTAGAARSGPSELPPECDAFLVKYESCLKTSVPSLPDVAKQRSEQTRAALQQEAERTGATATSLAALTAKCRDNTQRLATSCGPSRTN